MSRQGRCLCQPIAVRPQLRENLIQPRLPVIPRGTLRNFGLKVGIVSGSRYEARVRELVAGFPRLAAIAEPLLNVRRVMRQQFAVLHKMLLDTVRDDPVCGRLMTAPGVGAVVALTYRATVDQPATLCPFPGSRRACRPDAKALPVGRD